MSYSYTGSAAGGAQSPAIQITIPGDGDAANANSVNVPLKKLADFVSWLQSHAALIDAANGFSVTQQIATGNLELTNAAVQSLLKAGGGKLQVGTKTGNASNVEILLNGVVKAVFDVGDGKLRGQSTASGDAPTTLASKDYVDARPGARAWGKLVLGAAGAVTIAAGYNIASATWSSDNLSVVFTTPMGSADYAPIAMGAAGALSPSQFPIVALRAIASTGFSLFQFSPTSTVASTWHQGDIVVFSVFA